MKIINVTIISAGEEKYPGCSDLLEDCPGINIISRQSGLSETGTWVALGQSEVLLLDEAVLEQDGIEAVRMLRDSYPQIKILLVLDNGCENNSMAAISWGMQGVIERSSIRLMLCKAVAAVYSGEAWLSRGMAYPIRDKLEYIEKEAFYMNRELLPPGWDKLN
jgi:two-component system invasion response regulator UvrY